MALKPEKTLEFTDLKVKTDVFRFHNIFVIASMSNPDVDEIHIGGNHTDSPNPKQKWTNVEQAIEKISHKAHNMENKRRIHEFPYPGCKTGIFAPVEYLSGRKRIMLFRYFGQVVNYYGGRLHTAADVNTGVPDLMIVAGVTEYVLGLPTQYGGSGDPSPYTAADVVAVQKRILKMMGVVSEGADLQGIRFAFKGAAGSVGRNIIRLLYKEKATLYVADINDAGIEEICSIYPGAIKKTPEEIHSVEVDVYCPADSTVTLPDEKMVSELKCKLLCGPTNDQNRSEVFEDEIFRRGIIHLSMDGALENGGGLIHVVSELEDLNHDRHNGLVEKAADIFEESRTTGIPCYEVVKKRFLS